MFDSVVRNYLFQDFRLKPTRDKVILGIIAFVFVILAFLGWNSVLDGRNPFVIWIWFPYSILGSLIGYFILSFLDRERRVRSFHFLVILSVMLVTGPVAAFFNALSPAMLVTVGFIEEGMKIVPVILLAIYLPNLIRTRKDGIVYGALAGMGAPAFACTPDRFPDLMAAAIEKRDLAQWAAARGIVTAGQEAARRG